MTITLSDSFLVPKRICLYKKRPVNVTFGLYDTFANPKGCHIIREALYIPGCIRNVCQSPRLSDYPSNTVRNIVQVPGVGVRRGAAGERDAAVLNVGLSLDDEDCNAQSRIHGRGRSKEELLYSEFLVLKHASRILGHSSNPVFGFSMMEQVRLCAVWPTENWLGSSMNHIQGWRTV